VIEKSGEQKARIYDVMRDNILFNSMDPREMMVIVDAMEPIEFSAGDKIIAQGDVGDNFYIVDTGHCEIFVEGVGKVMDVGPGGSFGELALMYDAPRAATVVADAATLTWAMDQVTFKKTIMDATMRKRARHEAFISAVPVFTSLNDYERLTIADALKAEQFEDGDTIIREGEEGGVFYIVEEGEVKCTKEGVSGEVSRRLVGGDYFGERALITDEPRAATVTAVGSVVVQSLDRATFKRLLGPLEAIMMDNMEVYEAYRDAIEAASGDEDVAEDEDGDDEDDGGM
jgi:cAMP-dependent protein kinase regulator